MGDGFWNPADYVFNRYEGVEQQKGKTLFGNTFNKNYAKIPQEAQDYINGEIQKRIDSGYKLNKWFLRALENHVKVNWPDQVPYNWDISSFISSDKGMANAINKQNNSKRVGNTQEQVASAKPGDTVLYNGKSVALSENDINKAQQNTGANDPRTYADKQAQLEEEGKANADARASLTEASKPTEKEAALRANAQKAYEEKQQQKEQDWQDQQAKNQEQNAKDAEQTKQAQTSTRQSVIDKSVKDANEEKMQALYGNDGTPSIKGTVDTSGNAGANDQAAINARMKQAQTEQAKNETLKQQSADINQNTIDEINQGSTNVGDIATAVSEVSMPIMNSEARPENLVVDERLEPVENMLPPGGIDSLKLNKNNKSPIAGGQFGQNKKNIVAWINNRDKYPEGSADWIRCNDTAKGYAKAVIALAEPWEANND